MAKLDLDIPHHLPQEEALKRIKTLLSKTRDQHSGQIDDLKETWDGNTGHFSFSAKGFDLSGTLTVQPNVIQLRSEVPFAVSLFKGKISRVIQDKAEELLR